MNTTNPTRILDRLRLAYGSYQPLPRADGRHGHPRARALSERAGCLYRPDATDQWQWRAPALGKGNYGITLRCVRIAVSQPHRKEAQ